MAWQGPAEGTGYLGHAGNKQQAAFGG